MLENRLIITSRVLHNMIRFDIVEDIYEALPYCGYYFQKENISKAFQLLRLKDFRLTHHHHWPEDL